MSPNTMTTSQCLTCIGHLGELSGQASWEFLKPEEGSTRLYNCSCMGEMASD